MAMKLMGGLLLIVIGVALTYWRAQDYRENSWRALIEDLYGLVSDEWAWAGVILVSFALGMLFIWMAL